MIQLGNRRELFVDRYLIQKLEGAVLQLHEPQRRERALQWDKPWEGAFCAYVTVFQDGPVYRMYYRGWTSSAKGTPAVACYAESRDGIRWERPNLGLHEFNGSKDNNIVLAGDRWGTHNFAPFLDTRPGVLDSERYKALGSGSDPDKKQKGLLALVSADGIHWRRLSENPVITQGVFDSQNVAFWSEHEKRYVSYYRVFGEAPEWNIPVGKRTVARATSDDFVHWSDPAFMTYGDTPTEQLYTNQTTPYFRAPHIYIALPKRFVPNKTSTLSAEQVQESGIDPKYTQEVSEGVFMTTRGTNRYDRTFMEAFFRPGLDRANWVSRNNMAACGVVQTGPDEMSLYYSQHYAQPSHHLIRASLRLDGFASVRAGYAGGQLTTRVFTFAGSKLALNMATSAAGNIRVEMQDDKGNPLPGRTLEDCDGIFGDEIERAITWKGSADVSSAAGQPIRLRFELKDADLYSLKFD